MRNYWLKILLGALGVFAIGMIGVTIVRSGIAKVNSVVEGEGPISIPLGLIPFDLGGERLGKLDHVTLYRDSPREVSAVELRINLTDSLLAHGLAGCRLVANLEGDNRNQGVDIKIGKGNEHKDAFRCLPGDSMPENLVDFGIAIFQPGEVEVPLLLPVDVVDELQNLDFGSDSAALTDSIAGNIEIPNTDSIAAQVERQLDSAMLRRQAGESRASAARRFADSIRAEAVKQLAEDAEQQ